MGKRMAGNADELKLDRKSRHSFDWDAGDRKGIRTGANRRDRRGVRRTIRGAAATALVDWDIDELVI
ncbi:hypothetical protein CA951_03480 [Rhodococcus sp. NCIMB 12038]|nr:hypothetical protein CA951_03480 [Rhodococcus sp. NCIMB 12038]